MNNSDKITSGEKVKVKAKLKSLLSSKFTMPNKIRFNAPLEAFTMISRSIEDLIQNNREINALVEEFAAIPYFPKTSLDEVLRYLALRMGSIPKDNGKTNLEFLKTFVQPRISFEREVHSSILEKLIDLSVSERAILTPCFEIADLFDSFFLDWYHAVVLPMEASVKAISGEGDRDTVAKRLKELGLDNPYTVITDHNGSILEKGYDLENGLGMVQKSLAEMFPETLNLISDKFDEIRSALPMRAGYFHDYFAALRSALLCRKPDLLEELWKDVDMAWIAIPSKEQIIPVHMMESGYGDPIRISPEFRVMWRLQDGADKIEKLRLTMSKIAEEKGSSDSIHKLERLDIGLFVTIVDSGSGLDFRITGQAVPNRPEVAKNGMKIFLDDQSIELNTKRACDLVKSCSSDTTNSWIQPVLTKENFFLMVAGHELGHPIGITENLEKVTKNNKPLEELKATLLGLEAAARIDEDNKGIEPGAKAMTGLVLARIIRMMENSAFSNPTLGPYVNEATGLLLSLCASSYISFKNDRIEMPASGDGYAALLAPLIELSNNILKGYQSLDLKTLSDLKKGFADLSHKHVKKCRAIVDARSKDKIS